MRVIISIFALISLVLAWGGCAIIPLTQSETEEYEKSMENNPDSMDLYTRLQESAGRIPISIKVVRGQSSDVLKNEMVKSRRTFSGWTRFKKVLLSQEIRREELDIRTNFY